MHKHASRLQGSGEIAILALVVPLGDPFIGAESTVDPLELLARSVVLTLGIDTLEVIDIVLEAVASLILVGEASVEPNGLENVFAG